MRRTRIRQVSKRRRQRDAVYPQRRREVFERADGRCEFSPPEWLTSCGAPMTDVHHIAGRGGPDPHRLSNLIGLCKRHHDAAHANPEWSMRVGLMASRHGGAA